MTRRERMAQRSETRREWAEKARQRADAHYEAAHDAVAHIPPGQPILVGHHSERGHRAALKRSDGHMRKVCEESDLADRHEQAAETLGVRAERDIFSDDPDAIARLEARIAEREKESAFAKRVNAAWRKHKTRDGMIAEGIPEETASKAAALMAREGHWLKNPVHTDSIRASIQADRDRIKRILAERAQHEEAAATSTGCVVVVVNDWARVTFAEKPAREIINALKAAGYHWANGSWHGYADRMPAEVTAMRES